MSEFDRSESWFEVYATQSEWIRDRTRKGTRLVLEMSDSYPQVGEADGFSTPHRFTEPPTPGQVRAWVGMPWWIKFDPEKIEVIKVTHRQVRTEERVR